MTEASMPVDSFKDRLKRWWFGLRGKDPEAVIVLFRTGDARLSDAMCEEIRRLEPARRHIEISADESPSEIRRKLRPYRIGLAPLLLTEDRRYAPLRRAAFLLAPRKILAYNTRLERHHLRLRSAIASWLFLRGVPLDRIFLRPRWLCPWKRDRSVQPTTHRLVEGRAPSPLRRRVAILTPYFPYPLSHGGAVRIYYLLREMAAEFDLFLFAFSEGEREEDLAPVLDLCARVVLVPKPRYREPRWSTLLPPEAAEYRCPLMQSLIRRACREEKIDLLQVEYTSLATYGGGILVEHDVTFDLFAQVHARRRSLATWWDAWRWRRFERRAVTRYHRVVVMSEKDRTILGAPNAVVIPNGVDLARFHPEPERPGQSLLFIGSFRHFPNIVAYRFFTEQVWPALRDRFPDMTLTVVAGADPFLHWREHTGTLPAARGRAHPLARIRRRRAAALRRGEPRAGADARFRGDESQGAGGAGDAARGRIDIVRLRGPQPGTWESSMGSRQSRRFRSRHRTTFG